MDSYLFDVGVSGYQQAAEETPGGTDLSSPYHISRVGRLVAREVIGMCP